MGDGDGDGVERRSQEDGRCGIGPAFELLDHVGALQPRRLLDLAAATAPGRRHTEIGWPARIVDAGGSLARISCVAVAVPLGRGQVAAVTTLVAEQRPSLGLSAATRAAGTRIAALLNAPARTIDDSRQNSTQWKMGGR